MIAISFKGAAFGSKFTEVDSQDLKEQNPASVEIKVLCRTWYPVSDMAYTANFLTYCNKMYAYMYILCCLIIILFTSIDAVRMDSVRYTVGCKVIKY